MSTAYNRFELLLTVVLPASYLGRKRNEFGPKTKKPKLQNTFTAENETGRNYQNLSFSAPKTKTNFGRSLLSGKYFKVYSDALCVTSILPSCCSSC